MNTSEEVVKCSQGRESDCLYMKYSFLKKRREKEAVENDLCYFALLTIPLNGPKVPKSGVKETFSSTPLKKIYSS